MFHQKFRLQFLLLQHLSHLIGVQQGQLLHLIVNEILQISKQFIQAYQKLSKKSPTQELRPIYALQQPLAELGQSFLCSRPQLTYTKIESGYLKLIELNKFLKLTFFSSILISHLLKLSTCDYYFFFTLNFCQSELYHRSYKLPIQELLKMQQEQPMTHMESILYFLFDDMNYSLATNLLIEYSLMEQHVKMQYLEIVQLKNCQKHRLIFYWKMFSNKNKETLKIPTLPNIVRQLTQISQTQV